MLYKIFYDETTQQTDHYINSEPVDPYERYYSGFSGIFESFCDKSTLRGKPPSYPLKKQFSASTHYFQLLWQQLYLATASDNFSERYKTTIQSTAVSILQLATSPITSAFELLFGLSSLFITASCIVKVMATGTYNLKQPSSNGAIGFPTFSSTTTHKLNRAEYFKYLGVKSLLLLSWMICGLGRTTFTALMPLVSLVKLIGQPISAATHLFSQSNLHDEAQDRLTDQRKLA